MRPRASDSGSLTLENGVLGYATAGGVNWRVAVSDLAVIGEHTNANGPYLDDYVLVFLDRNGGWFEAPVYAERQAAVWRELSALLGAPLSLALCNSVEVRGRVVWPVELCEKPLFNFDVQRPVGRGRLLLRLLGSAQIVRSPSAAVSAHLQRCASTGQSDA